MMTSEPNPLTNSNTTTLANHTDHEGSSSKRKTSDDVDTEEPVLSALDILQMQQDLEDEAATLYPGKFDECTYDKGFIKQPLYACLTCYCEKYGLKKDEETDLVWIQPELVVEKNMKPAVICYSCSIACHADHELVELFNKRNCRCDCGSTLFQSISSCTLRDKKDLESKNQFKNSFHNFFGSFCYCKTSYPETEKRTMFQCVICEDWFHDSCIENLPDIESFEEFICRHCSLRYKFKARLEGTDNSLCSLPTTFFLTNDTDDLFLKANWRSHLCTCNQCLEFYSSMDLEFLLSEEEEAYVPETDEARNTSLFEAASNALEKVDRVAAIEGILAINELKDQLNEFLRPFAESHQTVTKTDIEHFFDMVRSKKAKAELYY